jgi:hypothetical protein
MHWKTPKNQESWSELKKTFTFKSGNADMALSQTGNREEVHLAEEWTPGKSEVGQTEQLNQPQISAQSKADAFPICYLEKMTDYGMDQCYLFEFKDKLTLVQRDPKIKPKENMFPIQDGVGARK